METGTGRAGRKKKGSELASWYLTVTGLSVKLDVVEGDVSTMGLSYFSLEHHLTITNGGRVGRVLVTRDIWFDDNGSVRLPQSFGRGSLSAPEPVSTYLLGP